MSIITIATSKGGAGKTTLAEIISGYLASSGHKVAAIDADYNHSFKDWADNFGRYPMDVHHELDEAKIVNLAGRLEDQNDVVVIDTAGAATQATVFAVGCADLVLIPVQLSSSDVMEAVKTARLVDSAAKMTRRQITTRVVLTDYQPYTNIAQHVEDELTAADLTPFKAKLKRLVAFKEMTFNGEVPTHGPGGDQVRKFMVELIDLLELPAISEKLAS
ncbi:MAG: ParA family protein [Pseudomonadota bacterium]